MIGLKFHSCPRLVNVGLTLGLALAPCGRAWAGPPLEQVEAEAEAAAPRFAEAPPEPEPEPEPDASGPLRIVVDEAPDESGAPEPAAIELEVPAPALDPSPAPVGLRTVDSKRPRPGTGLMTLGGLSMGASMLLVITALAGPGWLDMDHDDARIAGGMSLPLALAGAGMVVGGAKANKRFEGWARRNELSPPKTGNGMLVGGAAMTLTFAGLAAYSAQDVLTSPTHQRGAWAPTILAGSLSTLGMVVLGGGMLRRSKFASWEHRGYLMPGTMAVKGGGGLTISGRF